MDIHQLLRVTAEKGVVHRSARNGLTRSGEVTPRVMGHGPPVNVQQETLTGRPIHGEAAVGMVGEKR